MKYIIFTIDNHKNPLRIAAFYQSVKNNPNMQGTIIPCVGHWKGETEQSFMMRRDDFMRVVSGTLDVAQQEAFMLVSECNKQYYSLLWSDGHEEAMGCMTQVSQEEAMKAPGYTYRPDLNIYWVAKQGNPDRVNGENTNEFSHSIYAPGVPARLAAE